MVESDPNMQEELKYREEIEKKVNSLLEYMEDNIN